MGIGAAIGGIASGLMGKSASDKAADAQTKAAEQSVGLQRDIFNQTTQNFAPYLQAGNLGLQAFLYEMGLGNAPTVGGRAPQIQTITTPGSTSTTGADAMRSMVTGNQDSRDFYRGNTTTTPGSTSYRVGGQTFNTLEEAQAWARANPTGGTAYRGFQETPGYQFQFDQGTDAVNALAGARGGLRSGRTMQELNTFGQGIANQEYGNYLNRLSGLTNMGTGAAANQASAGQNYASNAGNALMAGGQAQANGAINGANAISGGINNALGAWQYQQMLGKLGA
ncbi:hypothetical protein RM190_04945 [Paracoccus sp. CPCC 101403]|uniref:DNA transfer protein p32 n=1 Tax=Paracoccus broussonetiae TaxID=3075834 RepID=A0ABU3EAF3_9RHOB|nr:hypothetical protein [Paracoccus sp. CPCC 101403]MDT1061196.1 hypothetical protein [Paracoccus sp. CPCC 101403]